MFRGKRTVTTTLVLVMLAAMFVLLPAGAQAAGIAIVDYSVPTANCWAWQITRGPDNAMWFTEEDANQLGRITTDGVFTEYPIPSPNTFPSGITTGPDGNIWFAELGGSRIGKVNTSGTVLAEYATPTPNSFPWGITTGPDGALWFTENASNESIPAGVSKVGRITTDGVITEYPLPDPNSRPMDINPGPDGALWFCEFKANKIGRITTSGLINEYPVPTTGGSPVEAIAAPDGALWFVEEEGNKIGRITTAGVITEYPIPTSDSHPVGITIGPEGGIWFSEWNAAKIGRISTTGLIQEFTIPTPGLKPNRLATGPDGRLWFCASASPGVNKIGAVTITQPTWYLAEGSTAWGFSQYISIVNPNPESVQARITYMTTTGPTSPPDLTLPANSQTTVNPADFLGSQDFSTKVTCLDETKIIAVDRTMTWTGQGAASEEAHNSIAVPGPETTWYLAEGSSAWGFECWLLIQNPNAADAHVNVTYMVEGSGPHTVAKVVPANSRATYNMGTDLGGAFDASIKVDSDIPVIPERSMYRNNRREGHDSIGTVSPSTDYYLAEGTTAWGFTTYVLIQNPNDGAANVTITYMTPTGPLTHPENPIVMPPNSRKTVRVNDFVQPTDLSTHVHADLPIIAERAMYWGADGAKGEACHDSIGMDSPHGTFYFPDGQTSNGRETWTLVQNPNSTPVTVEIKYLTPDGTGNVTKTETIEANSRKTFNMLEHSGINGRAAITVRCTTLGKEIMCERAMYWNNRGAGTDTIGGFSD